MKREEERDKNQVKKANVAANWYLLHIVGGQTDSSDRKRSTTLAADEAEANARTDTTFKHTKNSQRSYQNIGGSFLSKR